MLTLTTLKMSTQMLPSILTAYSQVMKYLTVEPQ